LVLPSLEPPAHTFRALESCWHAGEGLPYCPVTSRGSSGAANDRAGEEYQVRARYQIRANALLLIYVAPLSHPVGGCRSPSAPCALAFTRYPFASRCSCRNQPPFHSLLPPALPTLVQYYCTTIGQYTTPPPPASRLYAIHHTILVITISCKGQSAPGEAHFSSFTSSFRPNGGAPIVAFAAAAAD